MLMKVSIASCGGLAMAGGFGGNAMRRERGREKIGEELREEDRETATN
jgi:hypothetical protein